MNASFKKYILDFKQPSGTSRGVLHQKKTYFLQLEHNGKIGYGECGLFKGLSIDDRPDYESKLHWLCEHIEKPVVELLAELTEFPSIQFGIEQVLRSLKAEHPYELFPSEFTRGNQKISINGLIWMGDISFMKKQIESKLSQGYSTLKLKIGANDFNEELSLLKKIRSTYKPSLLELRVDANGAFTPENALEKLKRLSEFDLHSIEQPIKPKQWEKMAHLCAQSPLAIALDEELIGVFNEADKSKLLENINPQYIILKPSLIGGFKGSDEWIKLAKEKAIGWWITSALESNIGLNAIAQYTFTKSSPLVQGLGTGSLFTNNIQSPLFIENAALGYDPDKGWGELVFSR